MPSENKDKKPAKDLKVAALKYNPDLDSAPIVIAAGSGYVAQRILNLADECGLSIYHDDSAATLLSKLELGKSIPPDLYQLVVEIYMSVLSAADASKKFAPKNQSKANVKNAVNKKNTKK